MNLDADKLNDIFEIGPISGSIDDIINDDDQSKQVSESVEPSASLEMSVDVSAAYAALGTLVSTGKAILENSKYLIDNNPGDADAVTAAASMITALQSTIKEFTKVHTAKINYDRQLALEKLKLENKKELMRIKFEEMNRLIKSKNNGGGLIGNGQEGQDGSTRLVPFNQEKIIDDITKRLTP